MRQTSPKWPDLGRSQTRSAGKEEIIMLEVKIHRKLEGEITQDKALL